jgi:putative phosphoesterase
VRGNNDREEWQHLAAEALLRSEDVRIYILHDANELRRRALPTGVRVVVAGHSHQPSVVEHDEVLWVNPGSAGPRRFRLPISVGELMIDGDRVRARLITLESTLPAG